MKYTITYKSKSEVINFDTNKPMTETSLDTYETNDVETCKNMLKEFVDPPEYELTDENIKKNFGEKIRQESIEQIRAYYGFRKQIYGDFLEDISKGVTGIFRYDVPEDVNHYEIYIIDEEILDDIEEKQIEYYIELKIEK